MNWKITTGLLCIALLPLAHAQSGPAGEVFHIGEFDRSSAEFHQHTDKEPTQFIVGQSVSAEDWHATQAAQPATVAQGSAASSARTIQFQLDGATASAYKLRLAFLIESPAVPVIQVSINGKRGRFYLQPELDNAIGDHMGQFSATYAHADAEVSFPGSYLHQGANTIVLEAIAEGDDVTPEATITYDALQLSVDPTAKTLAPSAEVIPTVFYRRQGGQLKEIVEVILRDGAALDAGSTAVLSVGGREYTLPAPATRDFGEQKIEFLVSEFTAGSKASLRWSGAGRTHDEQATMSPAKKWTLYLAPHIHLDVGFTDYQAKVAAVQSRVIDQALDLFAANPKFTFSLDGEWNLEQFMKSRTPAEQQRAIAAIKSRNLFVPGQYANLLTGFPTAETLIRSLYPSANFSREHGTPFDYANITDVPSYSWSYASVLASAGIKYFIAASNNHRAPVLMQGLLHQQSPFYWQGPDGKKVLMWYSRGYQQMQYVFGLPPHLSGGRDTIPLFLQIYKSPQYRANAAILYGSEVENTELYPQQAELVSKWNSVYAYPHMEYSSFVDALKEIEKQAGDSIPTVSGDGGPYWELGIGSEARNAAIERSTEMRAPSAEKLSTLTSLLNPRIAADKPALDRMWQDMLLMDEHTFESNNSVTDPQSMEAVHQLAFKDALASDAEGTADYIARNSMSTLADAIPVGRGNLIVFNTLNWTRDGVVSFDLDHGDEIVDRATGEVAPIEVLADSSKVRRVRFVAEKVPAVGYKVYELRKASRPSVAANTASAGGLENAFYKVELDPETGAVRSIYDKQLQRELVNQNGPYKFGQYLYVTGGDRKPNGTLLQSWYRPQPQLEIHPATGGHVVSIERTPHGTIARLTSTGINTPLISTEIRLFDNEKKIEFDEEVQKKSVTSDESVYFAFPFAMSQPKFQYEIQTGVVDPATTMYPGAGHEWFSVQHWAAVEQGGLSAAVMPLDVPLMTFGDINRDAWPKQFGERPGTIFSYAMNNYWEDNYQAGQGGTFHFRYVMTSATTTDAAALSRMGWEEATPLEADKVLKQDRAVDVPRTLSATGQSFLDTHDANLLLQTWKTAEDGNGTILRFLDLGGSARSTTIRIPLFAIERAWETDAVERDKKPLAVSGNRNEVTIDVQPHAIITVRLVTRNGPEAKSKP